MPFFRFYPSTKKDLDIKISLTTGLGIYYYTVVTQTRETVQFLLPISD